MLFKELWQDFKLFCKTGNFCRFKRKVKVRTTRWYRNTPATKRIKWEMAFVFSAIVLVTYMFMENPCTRESNTQIFTVLGVMVACAGVGLGLHGQAELMETIKENTKATQDLRAAIIAQGMSTPKTIPKRITK